MLPEPIDAAPLATVRSLASAPSLKATSVIIRASNVQAQREVHRHIGINSGLSFQDLGRVLAICFGFADSPEDSPTWTLDDQAGPIEASQAIRERLATDGDRAEFHWGLWEISLEVIDSYPRDESTPAALCLGGSGSFGGEAPAFDIAELNAELTGRDTIRRVLSATRPEVRSVIARSELLDFVPLLQALDLAHDSGLPEDLRVRLGQLPVETSQKATDAFWSSVLALSCLSGEELTNEVASTMMEALGSPLRADEIHALCSDSLGVLNELGAYGEDLLPSVDRLPIYRELLSGER